MSIKLYIDTTDFNSVTFGVSQDKKIIKQAYKIDPHQSHKTLAKLEEFLKSQKISATSPALPPSLKLRRRGRAPSPGLGRGIKKIYVNKGPGSYTGVRIGVTIAQALGFAWNVPVKAVAKHKFVMSN